MIIVFAAYMTLGTAGAFWIAPKIARRLGF